MLDNDRLPLQVVRLKRRHAKSRTGCRTCKMRRVKCDETLPHCRVCSTRFLHCEYAPSHQKPKEKERSESPVRTSINSSITCSPTTVSLSVNPNNNNNNNIITSKTAPDALLWQFYLAHASKTMTASSTDPAHTRMWAETVPTIAFSSPVVSHALMAFSALCLEGSQRSRLKGELRGAAERHYYQAVKLLRSSLAIVEQEQDVGNADVVLACGMILIPCGLALVRGGMSDGEGGFGVGGWVWHLRGWRVVGERFYGNGGGGGLDSKECLIPYPQPGIPDRGVLKGSRVLSRRCSKASMPFLDLVRRSWLDAVDKLKLAVDSHSGYDDSANTATYLSAITALEYVVDYILDFPVTNLFRAIFTWPILITPDFIELLASDDGLALAIYAHWLVLTVAVEDLWWLEGFGSGQIERIVRRAVGMRSCGAELLGWPVEMLDEWCAVSRVG